MSSFNISFLNNGRSDNEPRARVMGSCRAELAARRINGGGQVRKLATRHRGTKFEPLAAYVPNKVETTAESFAAIIMPFQRKVVANIADVSPETVKAWRKGRQVPRADHIFVLAQNIPAVRQWALRKLGAAEMPAFMSPEVMTAMFAAMHQVAQQPGPDGDAIRAVLSGAGKARTP